jgi:hypothetical protein
MKRQAKEKIGDLQTLQDIRLTTGVSEERLKSTESVHIVLKDSLQRWATDLESNAPRFNVLIEEDVMKSWKMVLAYHDNQLRAFEVPGLAEKVVQKCPH